jgi:hypothetical protein
MTSLATVFLKEQQLAKCQELVEAPRQQRSASSPSAKLLWCTYHVKNITISTVKHDTRNHRIRESSLGQLRNSLGQAPASFEIEQLKEFDNAQLWP